MVSNPNVGSGSTAETILSKHQFVLKAAEYLHLTLLEKLVYKDIYAQHQEKFQDLGIPIRPLEVRFLVTEA